MILMEEFKECVPDNLKIYLNEERVDKSYCYWWICINAQVG